MQALTLVNNKRSDCSSLSVYEFWYTYSFFLSWLACHVKSLEIKAGENVLHFSIVICKVTAERVVERTDTMLHSSIPGKYEQTSTHQTQWQVRGYHQRSTSEPMSFTGVTYRGEGLLAETWMTQRQLSGQKPISAWVRAHNSWKLEVYYIT